MDAFFTGLGLFLLLTPLLLIAVAWVIYRKRPEPVVGWRGRVFLTTLVGSILNYAIVWLDILIVPHLGSASSRFASYATIGRAGELFSFALFACALAGTGPARAYAALAALGVLGMWISLGLYSF